MRQLRGKWLSGALIVLMGATLSATSHAQVLKVGDRLPEFSLRDINGQTLKSSNFKGTAVWLNFFHSQ